MENWYDSLPIECVPSKRSYETFVNIKNLKVNLVFADTLAFKINYSKLYIADNRFEEFKPILSTFFTFLEKKKLLKDLFKIGDIGIHPLHKEGESSIDITEDDIKSDILEYSGKVNFVINKELNSINFFKSNIYLIDRTKWITKNVENYENMTCDLFFHKRLRFTLQNKETEPMDVERFDNIRRRFLDVPEEDRHMLFDCWKDRYIVQDVDGNRIEKEYTYEETKCDL